MKFGVTMKSRGVLIRGTIIWTAVYERREEGGVKG